MPIDFSWYVPLRVIHMHVYEDAGIEEIEEFSLGVRKFLEDGTAPIHILLDDANALPPPINLQQLKLALSLRSTDKQKLGWVIGVGNVSVITKVVISLLTKVLDLRYVRLATFEEAITFLKKQDKSLQSNTES